MKYYTEYFSGKSSEKTFSCTSAAARWREREANNCYLFMNRKGKKGEVRDNGAAILCRSCVPSQGRERDVSQENYLVNPLEADNAGPQRDDGLSMVFEETAVCTNTETSR